jgi:ABC-2 type transport system ATP-binding protein
MPLIATNELTLRYPGGILALDRLDIEIESGLVGLVGANGAGKSTLLKILLGLLPPTAGRAEVFGLDVTSSALEIRQRVGYMPEHDCLPPDVSATEFVSFMARLAGLPANAARERTADVLRHVGLYEERYRQIGGYSTGMKQRVKLAQALVHDPRLIFLDEPTNGLDPAGRDQMLGLIARIGREFGITVVVASHLLGEIERVCTFLLAIDGGRLLRAAPIGAFTVETGLLSVEVEDGAERLADHLRRRGIDADRDGRALLLRLDGGGEPPYDAIRDAIDDLGLALVRIERGRSRLEDLFRDHVGGAA